MPDATGLELIAQELRDRIPDSVLGTTFFRGQASVHVAPPTIGEVLEHLRGKGYTFLSSVHGLDYYPEEPRLGMHYELLNMREVDRLAVKLRVPTDDPVVPSVTPAWPTANHQEREAFDMFGVVFEGHPDLRRILMPDEFTAFPLRKDYPLRGRGERHNFPVLTRAES